MNTYKTAEVAAIIGVHPNTVRLYEKWEMIPSAKRQSNGYRAFTEFHIEQFKLARLAFQVEVLQNGLRKKMIQIIKTSAKGDFENAIHLAKEYLQQLKIQKNNANEAVLLVKEILSEEGETHSLLLTRKEASDYLNISMDTLRNWEMNGLLAVRRKKNGYRIYTDSDIKRLKIISSLRCANYSLQSILQMLIKLSKNPNVDILEALNTPKEDTDIVGVCDKLIISLVIAENNALKIIEILNEMKIKFAKPSTLPPKF